jgi:hypothetical protein
MFDNKDNKKDDPVRCGRCGSDMKIVTSRVTTFRQSYMNIFHCEGCGGIESIEVPHETAKRYHRPIATRRQPASGGNSSPAPKPLCLCFVEVISASSYRFTSP